MDDGEARSTGRDLITFPEVGSRRAIMVSQETVNQINYMADLVVQMGEVPRGFVNGDRHPVAEERGKPNIAKIKIAMLKGAYLEIDPLQALQIIAVINGIPCVYGDGALALIRRANLLDDMEERFEGAEKTFTAVCRLNRKGQPTPIVRRFSWLDAERAGLTAKTGPWQDYPQRMLQMRARAWACRDGFGDVLSGLGMAEEALDVQALERDAASGAYRPSAAPPRPTPPAKETIEHEERPAESGAKPGLASGAYQLVDQFGEEREAFDTPAQYRDAIEHAIGMCDGDAQLITLVENNQSEIVRAIEEAGRPMFAAIEANYSAVKYPKQQTAPASAEGPPAKAKRPRAKEAKAEAKAAEPSGPPGEEPPPHEEGGAPPKAKPPAAANDPAPAPAPAPAPKPAPAPAPSKAPPPPPAAIDAGLISDLRIPVPEIGGVPSILHWCAKARDMLTSLQGRGPEAFRAFREANKEALKTAAVTRSTQNVHKQLAEMIKHGEA
jgi:hypothetical protein